ncbi:MAG: MarR family transcriptional regulator [Chloroflexi bacterium]|nr:MarR family transcriptional regulator [Chloroflexota bacterium]
MAIPDDSISLDDYRALARFRYELRRFLHFSGQAARSAHLEPQQHQLLLALKGLAPGGHATVGQLADWLQIQHNSAVELAGRVAERGFITREQDRDDRRRVQVRLTSAGESVLRRLSIDHRAELRLLAPALLQSLRELVVEPGAVPDGNGAGGSGKAATGERGAAVIESRVLRPRRPDIYPRGLSRRDAAASDA